MKLLVGPANTGKSERVIARVGEVLTSAHKRVILISPSSNASEVVSARLQQYISESQIQPVRPMPEPKTFPGLYTDILAITGNILPIIKPIERDRLLRRVIKKLNEGSALEYFAESASSSGLSGALAGFIDELWRSGTDPAGFSQLAFKGNAKDRDIGLIFEQYTKALESAQVLDSEGAALMAVRVLESIRLESKASPAINRTISLVAVDGFNLYTPVQVKLLSLLSSLGVEVTATLTYREGQAVHLWQRPTMERFHACGAEILEHSATGNGQINRAAALLMSDDTENLIEGSEETDLSSALQTENAGSAVEQEIVVASAPDRTAEVRLAAREIKRLILERGYNPDEITITCRSISLYAHHLERVFAECSLPLSLDSPYMLGENPLVYILMKLPGLAAGKFPRRAVLDVLRSPCFDLSSFGLDYQSINLIDESSLAQNVTGGEEQWMNALKQTGLSQSRNLREIHHGLASSDQEWKEKHDRLAESLKAFFDSITLPRADSIKNYEKRLRELIERLSVAERARQGWNHTKDHIALETFLSALDDLHLGAGDPDEIISFESFYSELERAVASATFERPRAQTDCVMVQEIHNLRPRRYHVVFVMGLIEGEFPVRITETFPYTLVERDQLRSKGIDLTETTGDPGADLLQFYRVMTSATEKLYLSYARTDIAGGELLRSYLIDEVRAVAPHSEIPVSQSLTALEPRSIISYEELALITARRLQESILEKGPRVFSEMQGEAIEILKTQLPGWTATIRGIEVEYGRIRHQGRERFSGFVSDPNLLARLKERFGPGYHWSASQINDYGVCPFRFFAKHVLKLREAGEPVEGFIAAKLGTAYHRVLERVYKRIRNLEMQITIEDEDRCAALVEDIAEAALEEMSEKGEVRKDGFWEFEKSEIKRHVTRLLIAESEWNRELAAEPINFEMKFGEKGTPSIVVECEDGEIAIGGSIDRVDRREDGLVVVDYKIGRTPINHRDALEGRNIQLPIYVMAASQMAKNDRVASAYYLHVTSRKKGSELPKGNDESLSVDAMISLAESYVRDYVMRVRRGRFAVSPNGGRCLKGCQYRVMCRIQSLGASANEDINNGGDGV